MFKPLPACAELSPQAPPTPRWNKVAGPTSQPLVIRGPVVHGRHLGRTLGFPTANVELGAHATPPLGVYATRTRLPDGRHIDGVANVGENPTVGRVAARLEVWLFDFNEDLYGKYIETSLVEFIRSERHFISVDVMINQIIKDAERAKSILSGEGKKMMARL